MCSVNEELYPYPQIFPTYCTSSLRPSSNILCVNRCAVDFCHLEPGRDLCIHITGFWYLGPWKGLHCVCNCPGIPNTCIGMLQVSASSQIPDREDEGIPLCMTSPPGMCDVDPRSFSPRRESRKCCATA